MRRLIGADNCSRVRGDDEQEGQAFRRMSMRGLAKADGEWLLVCIAHNLVRLFRHADKTVQRGLRGVPEAFSELRKPRLRVISRRLENRRCGRTLQPVERGRTRRPMRLPSNSPFRITRTNS